MGRTRLIIGVSAAIHALSFVLMLRGVEPIHTFFYLLAWWTFIPLIAALNDTLGNNSLMIGKGRQPTWLAGYSVVVWLFFELWNFRLLNWSYIGVPDEVWLRWPAYALSFATVLPAILEVNTLFGNLRFLQRASGPVMRISPGLLRSCETGGLLMMLGVAVFPRTCFPLLWVAPVCILEPVVYRHSRDASLLGQVSSGDYSRVFRLMVAGLACGLLWEFWNFWSGAKWIYTLPYFDFWKVFEMPLVGFLGFMPFALECYLFWQVLCVARERFDLTGVRALPIVVAALIFSSLMFTGIDAITVLARQVNPA